jgi:hypothetical protein
MLSDVGAYLILRKSSSDLTSLGFFLDGGFFAGRQGGCIVPGSLSGTRVKMSLRLCGCAAKVD